jgi:hypothetical protein
VDQGGGCNVEDQWVGLSNKEATGSSGSRCTYCHVSSPHLVVSCDHKSLADPYSVPLDRCENGHCKTSRNAPL